MADSGGGSRPRESARSLSHARVPWPGLSWPRDPWSESSGPQFQLGDTLAVEFGWPSLPSSGPSRKRLDNCLIVVSGTALGQQSQVHLSIELAKAPEKWGRKKMGKRRNTRRERCPPALFSKQDSVMNRSWGSEFTRPGFGSPPLHSLAGQAWTSPHFSGPPL